MWVIRRLYHFVFLRPYHFVVGTILAVFGLAMGNLAPFFVKWLTQAVQSQDIPHAFSLIFMFGGVLLLGNILENLSYYITDINMVSTSTAISHAVLTHIHNLDFAYHTNKSSGKLISLMKRGDEAFFTYYDTINRQFLSIFLSFAVMFGAFVRLSPKYILFVLALMAVSIVISFFLVKINIKKRNIFNKADDEVSSARVDNLVNFDTVKYFANEKFEQERFSQLLGTWDKTLQGYFFTFRYFDVFLGNIINVSLVGIMLLALMDLSQGLIALPEFLLVTTFSMTLFPKLVSFLYNLRELAKRYSDLNAYFKLLEEQVSVIDPVSPQEITNHTGSIEFDHVAFTYESTGAKVLKDFNLEIKGGEAIAFVGYSGAGKTTIAKLLMRMYDPQSGSIRVDGVDIRNLAKSTLRKLIGIVPQDPLLFNNTVKYNIAYANDRATEQDITQASEAAKVDEFVQKLTSGYDTVVGERGIKLSGGQRQRLAIARVLLEQPEILIFDEATSALDSASEQRIQAAFWSMVKDKKHPRTAIIIAHRLSTIMKADRIVVMDRGKIVDIGTHQELLDQGSGIYHKLWSLQRDGFIGDGEVEV